MMHFYRPSARQHILRLLAFMALSVCGLTAHAAITCSIAPPSAVNIAYVASTSNVQQGSVSVTCTRTLAADASSVTLDLGANTGNNGTGQGSDVTLGSAKIAYSFYTNSACSSQWLKSNYGKNISVPLSMPSVNVPVTSTFNYWACIGSQSLSSYTAGLYTDAVGLQLSINGSNMASASIAVNLHAPAVCTTSNGPGNLTFTYNAFSPTAVFAGTSFVANCTHFLPYTMTLNPVSGVVAGLRYTLGLSLATAGTASNTGAITLSTIANATGSATHYINGSMAAAQAGQTGTPVPQTHTLTLTY
jgi:spore coat protein U-like protein